jgi:hypothetical protein
LLFHGQSSFPGPFFKKLSKVLVEMAWRHGVQPLSSVNGSEVCEPVVWTASWKFPGGHVGRNMAAYVCDFEKLCFRSGSVVSSAIFSAEFRMPFRKENDSVAGDVHRCSSSFFSVLPEDH